MISVVIKTENLWPKTLRAIGLLGTVSFIWFYAMAPSFPTPDKILILGLFIGLMFSQAVEVFKRLGPFVALLLVYESFRGIADGLNSRVNYNFMPEADKLIFMGHLPTTVLQNLWWNGQARYYDFIFYFAYMMHFLIPLVLAVYIWKKRAKLYWRFVTSYVAVSFAAFFTYLAFPAAPPWMASDHGIIEPITRISSQVFAAMGIADFPSIYNDISPNAVAAMPSLHAAYALLFVFFIYKLFSSPYRHIAWLYPALIWIGTIYQGEHYAIDIFAGIAYAAAGYFASPYILRALKKTRNLLLKNLFRQQ